MAPVGQTPAAIPTPVAVDDPPDRLSGLPVRHRHAAGSAVGSFSHGVGVAADRDVLPEFPAPTDGRKQLVAYLHLHPVRTVARESSGSSGIAREELLPAEGFAVLRVDPRFTQPIQGRPPTDPHDCPWLQRLHAPGLLASAFRPDEPTGVWRSYVRQRANRVRYAGPHRPHLPKALEPLNRKRPEVVSDLTGVTGRSILPSIRRGVREPLVWARHRDRRGTHTAAASAPARNGSYREEQRFELPQAFERWQTYPEKRCVRDEQMQQQWHVRQKRPELPPLPAQPRQRQRQPNEPRFAVRTALAYVTGVDRTTIEGIDVVTALVVVRAIGTDRTRWPTVKHFTSWLGLCPQLPQTGGHVRSSRTRPGSNRAADAGRLGASALPRQQGAMGAFVRRRKSRLGTPKAVTAAAHQLARIGYGALRSGREYVQRSPEEYEAALPERPVKSWKRKARLLGWEVGERPAPGASPAAAAEPGQ
jgi:transposase